MEKRITNDNPVTLVLRNLLPDLKLHLLAWAASGYHFFPRARVVHGGLMFSTFLISLIF
jgi:hypothetical protein